MTTMQLELPEDVAERMRDRGMLNSEGVTAILRDAMTRREEAFDRFLAVAEKLEAAGISFTEEEIAEEIRAVREERRDEAFDYLLALPGKLEAAGISFTEEEIAEEIRAYREERAAQCGG